MSKQPITIGLFGTCDNSTWRNQFISTYQNQNIEFFNPLKENWQPKDAQNEAKHLASDEIILFPILKDSFGLGSLSETGFSILNAINLNKHRQFVIQIDSDVQESLKSEKPELAKLSKNTRAIIQQHLSKLNYDNVYIVNNLNDMLELSLDLYAIEEAKAKINAKYRN